jgi:hypothetical protein
MKRWVVVKSEDRCYTAEILAEKDDFGIHIREAHVFAKGAEEGFRVKSIRDLVDLGFRHPEIIADIDEELEKLKDE